MVAGEARLQRKEVNGNLKKNYEYYTKGLMAKVDNTQEQMGNVRRE